MLKAPLLRANSNQLRIIGGQWRSRKLSFPDVAGLRPTPDRVRETLFNWLQPVIQGARCLDLFAGSGALGFEALSRGASVAVFVERDAQAIRSLRQHVETLHAAGAQVVQADAVQFLQQAQLYQNGLYQPGLQQQSGEVTGVAAEAGVAGQKFNVVFLDPPFRHTLLQSCCRLLEEQGWLHDKAYIYLEAEGELGLAELPPNWQITHSKSAGQVGYYLVLRTALIPAKQIL